MCLGVGDYVGQRPCGMIDGQQRGDVEEGVVDDNLHEVEYGMFVEAMGNLRLAATKRIAGSTRFVLSRTTPKLPPPLAPHRAPNRSEFSIFVAVR
jgi:hypothetical protein